ncbi:hypothetical protein GPA10_32550 [Streptomyces sp. p1417]|uniref:Uncharacterized protein n=1 Tax=Streptomyces typhae TaxID=2681492 RepID=A0A6L6X6J8_9ACTN|nr:hypothetical protein [Streptomyces typhae]MVO89357.1 hypothetical protein [Streptomyces typhae]
MRCTHWRRVPLHLAREARARLAAQIVDSAVRCQLSAHGGAHYGLLDDLGEYGTALWLRWQEKTDVDLVVLPDCPAVAPSPDGEGCCLFVDHAERHTWEDTLAEITRTG